MSAKQMGGYSGGCTWIGAHGRGLGKRSIVTATSSSIHNQWKVATTQPLMHNDYFSSFSFALSKRSWVRNPETSKYFSTQILICMADVLLHMQTFLSNLLSMLFWPTNLWQKSLHNSRHTHFFPISLSYPKYTKELVMDTKPLPPAHFGTQKNHQSSFCKYFSQFSPHFADLLCVG